MNKAQLRESTYRRLGITSADAQFTAPVVDDFVNEAIHAYETEHNWPWLEALTTHSTTAGTGTITVPTDWLLTRYLQITDRGAFQHYGKAQLDELYTSTGTGEPEAYAIAGDTIYVRPTPNAVYSINHLYIKREPDLTSDTDTPLMPASFHMGIVEYAAYLGFRRTGEEARAAMALDAYSNFFRRMVDNRRRSSQPTRVRVRPGRQF